MKHTLTKEAIDREKYATIQAVKSIISPPPLLDVGHFEDDLKAGRTTTMSNVENNRRIKQYESSVLEMVNYITTIKSNTVKEERKRIKKVIENNPLVQVLEYAFRRGSGHTYAEVFGVKNTPNAILVVENEHQKESIKDVPKERIVSIIGDNQRFFSGRRHPVVIDHFVVQSEIRKILQSLNPNI